MSEEELYNRAIGTDFTPGELKILENFLAIRIQKLAGKALKEKSTTKAHEAMELIKKIHFNSPDRLTVVINFDLNFTIKELLDEFRRNPSGKI